MRSLVYTFLLMTAVAPVHADDPDLMIADFEKETYGDWKVTGEAFGPGPARGTLPNQMHVEGFEGKGLVNSFFKGDGTTGTLTSPEFTIERSFINFLIGGGKHEGQTCINLLVDGKVVRSTTGPNGQPGGTERLDWSAWDVADLKGKKGTIEIVDKATGGWGHINVDSILQSNTRRGSQLMQRQLVVEKDFLLLPVKNGAAKPQVRLLVDGQIVREFEIELTDGKSDFVVSADISAFRGKTLVVEAMLPFGSKALAGLEQSATPPSPSKDEPKRPQFHFTSRRGWLNDPNGLVYLKGEWHLFYQHNPYGWNWGNMHWGHAVSRDLLQWTELPTALYPKRWGDWAFSGSAIVDSRNTAGFKTGQEDVLVAAFTSTGRGECIAYSNDGGRTWVEYEKNPVVKHTGRDPKVIWHEPTQKWVMAVYDEPPGVERGINFYSSPNLKDWTFTSRIEGFFECPDLFQLPVDGDVSKTQWVIYGADGKYLLGDFDGQRFMSASSKQQVWYGKFYAAQTFSDVPDGRRIQIGWANGVTFPGQPFNQQMTIPVELTLRSTPVGVRMLAWPVKELDDVKGKGSLHMADRVNLVAGKEAVVSGPSQQLDLFDLKFDLEPKQANKVSLQVCGKAIEFDIAAKTVSCDGIVAPTTLRNGRISIRVVGDRGSLEIFTNEGEEAVSAAYSPSQTDRSIKARAEGADAELHGVTVREIVLGNR